MSRSNPVFQAADLALRFGLRLAPPSSLSEHIALWWGYRFQPGPEAIKLRSGAQIQVFDIEHSQLLLRYLGTFEPHCLAYLYKYATPGATVLDVGANIGLYTIEASRAVGASGHVIAIEAAPSHARSVESSIILNGSSNVTVVNVAVGSETGLAILSLPSNGNMGMFTLGNVDGNESCTVPVKRIDDIMDELGIASVDFIKMDIEGSELRALNGAASLLKRHHPPILIELNEIALNACGATSGDVKALLFSFGYKGWIVRRDGLTPLTIEMGHECDECLFLVA